MSDHLNPGTGALRLPQRYGRITAMAVVPGCGDTSRQIEDESVRFFARRGLPVVAKLQPESRELSLEGRGDPSRHDHFREILRQWSEQTGSEIRTCAEEEEADGDETGGFEHACAREERCQALLDRICRDLGFPVVPGEGGRWAQAVGGAPEHIRPLAEAFASLRSAGRVSRFPNRGITVARQGTCAPYGLPAVLLKLQGTCRVFSERVGLRLLEATPRVISITEVAPAVVLVENTPPLDHIWDEARFWSAWQGLAQDAWAVIDAWAAVRVLRYVEAGGQTWKFYNHTHSPLNVVESASELPDAPAVAISSPSPAIARWVRRRCCEITLALQLGAGTDGGIRRHIIGHLATPYPFLQPIGDSAGAISAVEEYLAKAAAALHWELYCDENRGSDAAIKAQHRELAGRACVGLRSLQTGFLALNKEFLESGAEELVPCGAHIPASGACATEPDCALV